ncbi:hypothetical protein [Streptomyces sp. GESEQ-35]|uniref:hypothetical protein n=1 Tax=Streptomyces sp. GESEQ-35 TaxID=2812657 RepID=UPI001B33A067|nr:hypothetical protein [Streptomyces sp. GESEQ-35]
MDRATIIVVLVSIVAAKTCALLGLWLRLRWRVHRDQAQHQYLVGVAQAVAADGYVELDDQHSDGRRLRMKISRAPAQEKDSAA